MNADGIRARYEAARARWLETETSTKVFPPSEAFRGARMAFWRSIVYGDHPSAESERRWARRYAREWRAETRGTRPGWGK